MPAIQDAAFAPHQVDTLFLLVGTNPLPNAVAGQLLIRPNGQVVLVKTTRTKAQAGYVGTWIQKKTGVTPVHLEVADSDGPTISDAVYHAASKAARERRRIGLNYTGGTKAMAVHAYRAVEAAARDAGADCEFSYLDGRRLRMTFDRVDGSGGRGSSIPTITLAPFTIDELTSLHGWTLSSKPRGNLPLPEVATALALAQRDTAAAEGWAKWRQGVLEERCRKRRDNRLSEDWKSKTDLSNTALDWPTQAGLEKAVAMLKGYLGEDGPTFNVGALARATGFGSDAEELCRWLHGTWFESFVLDVIGRIANTCALNDYGADLKGGRVDPETNERTEFQFDV
ncbi:MAG: hypothetical protein ACREOS_09845, partial [Candidatus Dormibacteraceae bacterium]